jgi:hypothetical protein
MKIRPALSCEDVIAWDTQMGYLEMLSIATGTDWWNVPQPTRFAEIFTKMNALKHFSLEWAPASSPPNDHTNNPCSPRPITDFVNNLRIPASVESMRLTGYIAFSCLLSTWPFIKKLHVDSVMFDNNHGRLLNNFPALEELLDNGFDICSRAGFRCEVNPNAYKVVVANLLPRLDNNWMVQVMGECVIGDRARFMDSLSCMMLVFKKNE